MEVTPIRGFFLVGFAVSFVIFAAGGCKHFGGALQDFAGEYNDVYTGMQEDDEAVAENNGGDVAEAAAATATASTESNKDK